MQFLLIKKRRDASWDLCNYYYSSYKGIFLANNQVEFSNFSCGTHIWYIQGNAYALLIDSHPLKKFSIPCTDVVIQDCMSLKMGPTKIPNVWCGTHCSGTYINPFSLQNALLLCFLNIWIVKRRGAIWVTWRGIKQQQCLFWVKRATRAHSKAKI